jgi:hypothetical protein
MNGWVILWQMFVDRFGKWYVCLSSFYETFVTANAKMLSVPGLFLIISTSKIKNSANCQLRKCIEVFFEMYVTHDEDFVAQSELIYLKKLKSD